MDSELQHAVLSLARYLEDHPQACDSAQGICLWWFIAPDAPSEPDVQRGLNWLEDRGFIESLEAADGRVSYARVEWEVGLVLRVQAAMAPAIGH